MDFQCVLTEVAGEYFCECFCVWVCVGNALTALGQKHTLCKYIDADAGSVHCKHAFQILACIIIIRVTVAVPNFKNKGSIELIKQV